MGGWHTESQTPTSVLPTHPTVIVTSFLPTLLTSNTHHHPLSPSPHRCLASAVAGAHPPPSWLLPLGLTAPLEGRDGSISEPPSPPSTSSSSSSSPLLRCQGRCMSEVAHRRALATQASAPQPSSLQPSATAKAAAAAAAAGPPLPGKAGKRKGKSAEDANKAAVDAPSTSKAPPLPAENPG